MAKKRLLTGLQPSGALHIGNYFGALKPFADMYSEYESFLMVVDYHALTTLRDPKELRENIVSAVKSYLAAGVDPSKAIIFQQSQVQEHTELAWIFECLVTVPFLSSLMPTKTKLAKGLRGKRRAL
jgi:tryptophanyl-tRNA synthetase